MTNTTEIAIGSKVVIGPAYSMWTNKRDMADEATGVEGAVVELSNGYALIKTRTTEIHVNVGRLTAR